MKTFDHIKFTDNIYTAQEVDQIVNDAKLGIVTKQPLFSFSVVSDIHLRCDGDINKENGNIDLINLFKCLNNRKSLGLNLKYLCVAGDIGMDGKENEIKTFNGIINNTMIRGKDEEPCPVPRANVFACNGNHDQQCSGDVWRNVIFDESIRSQVTDDKNFYKVDGDFVLAFMSLAQQEDRNTTVKDRICYLDDKKTHTREWLTNLCENVANGKTLLLFMHYPLQNRRCADTRNIEIDVYDWVTGTYVKKTVETAWTASQYAGIIDRGGEGTSTTCSNYGFNIPSGDQDYSVPCECEQIINILKTHNGKTLVFSGHTHTIFQCEDFDACIGKGYPNINVARIEDTDITTIHTPSLNHPRRFESTQKLQYKNHSDASVEATVSKPGSVTGWKTISGSNPYRQPVQSWVVDVYEDKVVLKGYETNVCHDKKYGDILDKYVYTIDLEG